MPRNLHVVLIVSALFLVGNILFAVSLAPIPALAVGGGCVGSFLLLAWRAAPGGVLSEPVQWPRLCALLLAAFALLLIGGEGHVFFAKNDWLYRDAVLADLVARPFPIVYRDEGADFLLRAPLGMYLLPAAIGRAFTLNAAHFALLAQNSLVLGGFLYVVALLWPRARGVVLLFVLFSGLDVIPFLIKTNGAWLSVNLSFWSNSWNYGSNVTQLFWNPNHVLPAWWFAALGALLLRGEIGLTALAAGAMPLALWSPIALIGGAPFFVYFAFAVPRSDGLKRWLTGAVSAFGFLPVLAYLGLDAESVPHEWLIAKAGFFDEYVFFNIFALAQGAFVAALWRRVDPSLRGAVAVSLAALLAIPFYSLGYMNDFAQRVSLIPRAFIALAFAALLIGLLRERRLPAALVGSALAAIGAATPALEIYDSLTTPRFSISDCNLLTVHRKLHPKSGLATYFARTAAAPRWLLRGLDDAVPLEKVERLCWPDRVYGESLANWLDPEYRIWLRPPPGRGQAAPSAAPRP